MKAKSADLFGPGRPHLDDRELADFDRLKNCGQGLNLRSIRRFFFFSTRGKDRSEMGIAATDHDSRQRHRARFGCGLRKFSYKSAIPKFLQTPERNARTYTVSDLDGQLKALITTIDRKNRIGRPRNVAFFDMAANQTKFSELLKTE